MNRDADASDPARSARATQAPSRRSIAARRLLAITGVVAAIVSVGVESNRARAGVTPSVVVTITGIEGQGLGGFGSGRSRRLQDREHVEGSARFRDRREEDAADRRREVGHPPGDDREHGTLRLLRGRPRSPRGQGRDQRRGAMHQPDELDDHRADGRDADRPLADDRAVRNRYVHRHECRHGRSQLRSLPGEPASHAREGFCSSSPDRRRTWLFASRRRAPSSTSAARRSTLRSTERPEFSPSHELGPRDRRSAPV